jgi:uncharacterized protein (DUF1810 family)
MSEFSMDRMVRAYESYYERLVFGINAGRKTDRLSHRSE